MHFDGKVVIVTGSSQGIGRAIARGFAKKGALVGINSRSEERASEEVLRLKEEGFKAFPLVGDVSDYQKVRDLIKGVKKEYQRVDILVNNAGLTRDNLIMRLKEEDWDEVLAVNLKGAFNLTAAVSRIMLKQRSGSIINISSVVALTGNVGQANYISSKAGLIGFTKATALELASRGIRVNAIAPGFIETEMTESLNKATKEEMLSRIPLGYFGRVEDVTSLVLFLGSQDSSYITGQVISVDGGMSM